MQPKTIIIFVLAIVVLVGGIALVSARLSAPPASPYDTVAIAQCLKTNGATFYGAWWCPHCQNTKKLFGDGAKELPYVECSGSNPQEQLQVCKDKGIESYPMWIFSDGSRLGGERTIEELATKANCPLVPKQQ